LVVQDARGDRLPRVADDWYVGFHHGLAASFWRAAGATMADQDMRLVGGLLELPQGASVLDLPCGDGRLTVRLAAAGYAMTGIDLAAGEVERARHAAATAAVDARFLVR
jgi:2-polyprenyl-3-methyl-5-hydroxy-6-metoxy-1,4-benzoquinol methylase